MAACIMLCVLTAALHQDQAELHQCCFSHTLSCNVVSNNQLVSLYQAYNATSTAGSIQQAEDMQA